MKPKFNLILFLFVFILLSRPLHSFCGCPTLTMTPDSVAICLGSSTQLGVSATSGTPPYTYSWQPSATLNNDTIKNPVASPMTSTVYTVTVTESGGCSVNGYAKVFAPPMIELAPPSPLHVCFGASTVLNPNPIGGYPPITYSWAPCTQLSCTSCCCPTATPFTTTTYTVTANDSLGCTVKGAYTVTVYLTPVVSTGCSSPNDTICLGDSVALCASGGTSYIWNPTIGLSNPNFYNPYAKPTTTTAYTVVATDVNGCTAKDVITIYVMNPPCGYNFVKGRCFIDYNSNGVQDTGEPGYNKLTVVSTVNSKTYTTIPNFNGDFSNAVFDTGNVVTNLSVRNYLYSPALHSSSFPSFNSTDFVNFALTPIPSVTDVSILITTSFPRPHPGMAAYYNMIYSNSGTDTINGDITLIKDSRLSFVSSLPLNSYINGDTIKWTYSNLNPGQNNNINFIVDVPIPPAVNIGDVLSFSAIINPIASDVFTADNSFTLKDSIRSSYDPNDKVMLEGKSFTTLQAYGGEFMNYMIRFQNTGNDTAFKVIIRDTLDDKLIGSTFEMVASSHNNYGVSIENNKNITWTFNNIFLPDSNVNEPGSHGFVCYRVKPKSSVVAGDVIKNTAHIIFDYNQPVATNTEQTLIVYPVTVSEISSSVLNLQLYPNPANNSFKLSYVLLKPSDIIIEIYNSLGQKVQQVFDGKQNAGEQDMTIDTRQLPSGIYYVKLVNDSGDAIIRMIKM